MSTDTDAVSSQVVQRQFETGIIDQVFSLVYALLAYAVGAGALFWLFFAAADLVPYAVSDFRTGSTAGAVLFDAGLILLFGLQHTIMARPTFKQWWTQLIPAHLERSTYVLTSGIALGVVLWFWQPLPGSVWSVTDPAARMIVQAITLLGAAYVLFASFITNHFELFGLRQAWLHVRGRPYAPLEFRKNWTYRYSRHPIMLGLLVVFWAAPDMTMTRLVFAVMLTVYLFIGIHFEERTLVHYFGDRYREYRNEIGMFFTLR